jgi:hypothetical protein
MADAMDSPALAERMGGQARVQISRLSWADVVKKLVLV